MAADDDHNLRKRRLGDSTTTVPTDEVQSDLHPVVALDELVPPGPRLGPRPPPEQKLRGPTSSQELPVASLPERVPVPVIKGPVFQRAREAISSRHEADELLLFEGRADALTVERRDEIGALALATIILENLRRIGASRVSSDALERVVGPLLKRLEARELMAVEIEAFEVLQSFGLALSPGLAEPTESTDDRREGERVEYDPEAANIELIRRSVSEHFDLNILYYTGGRGELSRRRVTPKRVEAEKYLYAWCHSREDERVFRISRIAQAEPVGGRPVVSARPPTGSLAAPNYGEGLQTSAVRGKDAETGAVRGTSARRGRDKKPEPTPLFAGLDDTAPGAGRHRRNGRNLASASEHSEPTPPAEAKKQSSLFDDGEG